MTAPARASLRSSRLALVGGARADAGGAGSSAGIRAASISRCRIRSRSATNLTPFALLDVRRSLVLLALAIAFWRAARRMGSRAAGWRRS